MQVKQCICPDCGRIAEVRRQSNGKKLRYLYCAKGHGGLTTRSKADHWQSIEVDYLGQVGEFPQNKAQEPGPEAKAQSQAQEPGENDQAQSQDYQPEPNELPEVLEPESKPETGPKPEDNQEPGDFPTVAKIGLAVLAAFGVGGAMYLSNKKRGA